MTATHHCEKCGKKTTHIAMTNAMDPKQMALRCVVCGTMVRIFVRK